ncbi:hypothetical protein VHEMI05044 [[Torrubiella] hemipterigena]|uniref:DUF6923 domain-containing protein n=1 Tax=[Torrubiella] hemipterigena TaxID=1531966 RepID=A0A0A1SX09_9HYPO|nr:hypothetical protein VHEMI05044 [[Torrubiella] hemipterigena]
MKSSRLFLAAGALATAQAAAFTNNTVHLPDALVVPPQECRTYVRTYLVPMSKCPYETVTMLAADPFLASPTTFTKAEATGTGRGTVVVEIPAPWTTIVMYPTGTATVTERVTVSTIVPVHDRSGTIIVFEPVLPLVQTVTKDHTIVSVVTQTPAPNTVFLTKQYTGTSVVTAPITRTVTAEGGKAATVIVETPPQVTTITKDVTVTKSTEPQTKTVIKPEEHATTVIVEKPITIKPNSTVTMTVPYTGTAIITEPITVTVTPTSAGQPFSVLIESLPPPPKPAAYVCDDNGFLMSDDSLYKMNLEDGQPQFVHANGNNATARMNSIGYNSLDNMIYGISEAEDPPHLVRLQSNGTNGGVFEIPSISPSRYVAGDVDADGFFWAAGTGSEWIKVDLRPGSKTLFKTVGHGVYTDSPGLPLDWSYVPGGGNAMYSVSRNDQGTVLMKFDTQNMRWFSLAEHGELAGSSQWGAIYPGPDDEIFASENDSGEIWRFPIDGGAPNKVTVGPKGGSVDGARCILSDAFMNKKKK